MRQVKPATSELLSWSGLPRLAVERSPFKGRVGIRQGKVQKVKKWKSWDRSAGFQQPTESCAENCSRHLVPGISAAPRERAHSSQWFLAENWQGLGRASS